MKTRILLPAIDDKIRFKEVNAIELIEELSRLQETVNYLIDTFKDEYYSKIDRVYLENDKIKIIAKYVGE